jgi:hypothetical protein
VQQWPEELQPEDFQRSGLDAFTESPIILAVHTFDIDMAQVEIGNFPEGSSWIGRVIERAAVAIIDRNPRR